MAASTGRNNDKHPPYLAYIETSFQPLDISFHPERDDLVATALVDGSLEGEILAIVLRLVEESGIN